MDLNNLTNVEHKPDHVFSLHHECNVNNTMVLLSASGEEIESFFYSAAEKYIILIFFPITIVFGLISNFAFLTVVVKCPSMRTVTNYYLSNLAVADVLFVTTVGYHFFVSYLLSPELKRLFYHSSLGCAFNVTIQFMSHFTAIAIVVLVTFERYMCICQAVQHRLVASRKRNIKLIISAWTFGFIYSVVLVAPKYFKFSWSCILWPDKKEYEHLPVVLTTCEPIHHFYEHVPLIIQPIPYISALIVNCIMYGLIIKTLHERDSRYTHKKGSAGVRRNRSSHITRLLIANACSFFICYSPFYFTRFQGALTDISEANVGISLSVGQRGVVDWAAILLSLINSIMNPVIYSIASPQYRQAFTKVFACQKGKQLIRSNAEKKPSNIAVLSNVSSIIQEGTTIIVESNVCNDIVDTKL